MQIESRQEGDVQILELVGPLTAGVGDEVLRNEMNRQIAAGSRKILLNLSKVSRIDSMGIGELVASTKLAKRFGSVVKLVQINTRVKHILNLSQLLPVLDFYEAEGEALENFARSSPPR